MLNNKGQTLVLFVVVLPILILMLLLVIDVGKIIVLKQELNNISDIALDYGLDNIDNNNIVLELEELIKLNKKDIDKIDIKIENDKIYVNLVEKSDGIFSSFINMSVFNVSASYVGYMEENEKRIEKVGD